MTHHRCHGPSVERDVSSLREGLQVRVEAESCVGVERCDHSTVRRLREETLIVDALVHNPSRHLRP